MRKLGKNSLKYNFLLVFLACLLYITHDAAAHYTPEERICNPLTILQDTVKPVRASRDTVPGRKDTVPRVDSAGRRDSLANTTDTFSLKLSKDSLDAPVEYSASDSMVLDVPSNKIILYSKGNIIYKDMNLTADSIEMDQDSKMVTATFRRDSLGRMVGKPRMKQSESTMDADVIKYNFETQRGIT
ncbi:MAG TPA: hypothetical protein VK616_14930, partial [Flavitalea sp.]|nr:hypothetical protein [Flavitalea sp.]